MSAQSIYVATVAALRKHFEACECETTHITCPLGWQLADAEERAWFDAHLEIVRSRRAGAVA